MVGDSHHCRRHPAIPSPATTSTPSILDEFVGGARPGDARR
ncbi:hypothetical protein ACRAWD_32095 [Caulobacter segnis]